MKLYSRPRHPPHSSSLTHIHLRFEPLYVSALCFASCQKAARAVPPRRSPSDVHAQRLHFSHAGLEARGCSRPGDEEARERICTSCALKEASSSNACRGGVEIARSKSGDLGQVARGRAPGASVQGMQRDAGRGREDRSCIRSTFRRECATMQETVSMYRREGMGCQ